MKNEIIRIINISLIENWCKIYLEYDSRWSSGGGRITVNIGDDYIGSYLFTHVGSKTFDEFIKNCGSEYLLHKLFKTEKYVSVENSNELFYSIYKEYLYRIKNARHENIISAKQLRHLYEELKDIEFDDIHHLYNLLDDETNEIMSKIFCDEWFYEIGFEKINPIYNWQLECIKEIQSKI